MFLRPDNLSGNQNHGNKSKYGRNPIPNMNLLFLFIFLQQNICALQCLVNTTHCEHIGTVENHIVGSFKGLLTISQKNSSPPPRASYFVESICGTSVLSTYINLACHNCHKFCMPNMLDSVHCKIMHCKIMH